MSAEPRPYRMAAKRRLNRLRYVRPGEPTWLRTTRAMGLGFALPWSALYLAIAAPAMGWWPW